MSFFSPIFPIIALQALDNLRRSSCTQTFNHCSNRPYPHSHRVTPLNSNWDSPSYTPLQKISLKVNDTYLIWKEYIRSPRELNVFLNEFERREYYQGWQSPDMFTNVQVAREIVDQATTTFENVQFFETKLIKMKNELRQQARTEQVQKQLSLVKYLLKEVADITLPKKLTQASVKVYEKQAQEKLQDCERQIAMAEQSIIYTLSPENEKTKALGATIIVPEEADKTSYRNTENVIETVEAPIEKPSSEIPAPIIPEETPVAPIDLEAIKKDTLERLLNIHNNIEAMIEELKQYFPTFKNQNRDIFDILDEQLEQLNASLQPSVSQITEPDQKLQRIEKIKHQESVLQLIIDLIRSEAARAKAAGIEFVNADLFEQLLMKKKNTNRSDTPPETIQDAINLFLEAEKRNVHRAFAKASENEAFLHNKGFYKLAEHGAQYIQKLKNAFAILTKDSSPEEFKQYCHLWDSASGLSPIEVIEISVAFNRLFAIEKAFNTIDQQAAEKIEEWKKHHQFSLIDQLAELSGDKSKRTHQKTELTLNAKDINAFISATDELLKKIDIIIKKKDVALIDLIALYDKTNPERAVQVRKYFISQLKHDILTFIGHLESNFPIHSKSIKSKAFVDAIHKILDQTSLLLADYKTSSKFFGMNKKQKAIVELPLMDLVKYVLEIKGKLDAFKKEYARHCTN